MNNIAKLIDHYSTHYTDRLFYSKSTIVGKNYAIMYTHEQFDEVKRFVDNFSKYFPFYVWNEDQLGVCDFEDIDYELDRISKICWNDCTIVPQRKTKVNGIYGEVFLDFFERIVERNKLICTFASKRSFKSNYETTGFDNVLYAIGAEGIELIFSEAKFVVDCNSAKTSLLEDINGKYDSKPGHLSRKYFNDYISFVVQKGSFFTQAEKREMEPFFKKLNDVLINNKKDFVQFLVDDNIKINCVFFAIFESTKFMPEDLIVNYDSIKTNAEQQLRIMNINNYSIKIVFVPTYEKSIAIKGAIDENYNI